MARLRCQQPGSDQYVACDLILQERAGLEIVLQSRACMAQGNTVRITSPVRQVLTEDGCTVPAGTMWTINGVFDAGTRVAMEVEAPRLQFPADMRVQGAWPEWTLYYEDGADDDYDDLIMLVRALPE